MSRTTHTYARLDVSAATYKEIADKLKAAGYDHAFMEDGTIDMHGIGLSAKNEHLDPEYAKRLESR